MLPPKVADLTGLEFGRLTVMEYGGTDKSRRTIWKCWCSCGNIVDVLRQSLMSGNTTSCGCASKDINRQRYEDLRSEMIGKFFGRLTIENVKGVVNGLGTYECRCACGSMISVSGNALRTGNTTSCGCYKHDMLIDRLTTHGLSDHSLYSIWSSMIKRCYDPKNDSYSYYGGRGITVCEEWKHDPVDFISWGINNGYGDGLTLDRRNNDLGYNPNNCRWASLTEQNRNKRTTKLSIEKVTDIRKDTRSSQEIASDYGIARSTVDQVKNHSRWKL